MPTKLIRGLLNIVPSMKGGVVTIGNFDGVHLGHQRLLQEVVQLAKSRGVSSTLITFEPHPFEFFAQDQLTIPRITRMREKFIELAKSGIDYVLIVPFNQSFAGISAIDFATNVLQQKLAPIHIFVGDDFRFGYKRQGDFALLEQVGKSAGFSVASLPSITLHGRRVSSTWVREALQQGDLTLAAELLGRPYTMAGRIRFGDQIGRKLGFPTANIFLQRRLTPVVGVFCVRVHGLKASSLPGAANLGTRPTVDGTRTLLEVHLLDFNQDIYGRYVTVQFCHKLRDEEYYPNLDLLREQIAKDVAATKNYFE